MHYLNTKVFTGAALAMCAALSITTASAAPADDMATRSLEVRLGGLDLTAPRDQAILKHRLLVAAMKVCREDGGPELNGAGLLQCQQAAFEQAWSQASVMMTAAKGRALMAARVAPASAQPQTVVASAASPGR